MSLLTLNQELMSGIPAPVSGKATINLDTDGRIKVENPDAHVDVLTDIGWRGKNWLLNGEFSFAQRQVPTTLTNVTGNAATKIYGADRWAQFHTNAKVIQFRNFDTSSAPVTGLQSRYYGQFKPTDATPPKMMIGQILEGSDAQKLRGRRVRLQFKAWSGGQLTMPNFRLGILVLGAPGTVDTMPSPVQSADGASGTDPTWGTNLTALVPVGTESTGTIAGNGVTCQALTTTVVRFSATFDIPANVLNIIPIIWGVTASTQNDLLNIAEAGLYLGEEIRDWAPRSYGEEFVLLQRFYEKTFPLLIAPAASVSVASGGYGSQSIINRTGSGTVAAVQIPIQFAVRKFKVPTLTFFTPVAAGAVAYRHTGTTPAAQGTTAVNTSATTDQGSSVTVTEEATANAAIGDLVSVHWTAEAEL